MEHSFDIDIAMRFGIPCAIILRHIYFWVEKNRANEKHFYDGQYWTYNSVKAFEEQFPYLSDKQIRTALSKLEEEGLIVVGNYNQSSYDRTKWYAVTDKGFAILLKGQMHLPKRANGDSQKGEPIPDIIPDKDRNNINIDSMSYNIDSLQDINNNIGDSDKNAIAKKKDIDKFFATAWKAYPRKKGKGQISNAKKKMLYESVGTEQMLRCIERYKEYIRGKDEQYIMYGSSFFNSGYVDYLDENYGCEASPDEEDSLPFR